MEFTGTVIHGDKKGTALGYPTINIVYDKSVSGVYPAVVDIEGRRHVAAAFADPARGILEAHLLDFSGDLYGKHAHITLGEKIRDGRAFALESDLREAIAGDLAQVCEYFKNDTHVHRDR